MKWIAYLIEQKPHYFEVSISKLHSGALNLCDTITWLIGMVGQEGWDGVIDMVG